MGIFSRLFKKKHSEVIVPVKVVNEVEIAEYKEKRDLIINEFKEKTSVKSLRLIAKRGVVSLTDSKFGGVPYFPKNLKYPCNQQGTPLRLLAQLNFSELPKLDAFPQKGILQFYVNEGEHWGLDFDNPPDQNTNFCVIYHKDILSDEEVESDLPEFSKNKTPCEDFPFGGEFALSAELESGYMTCSDYRFENTFIEIYKKHVASSANTIYELEHEIYDDIWHEFEQEGHRISGYPIFCQEDPRGYGSDYEKHTTVLFQMGSDGDTEKHKNGEWEKIAWGDGGTANFFITDEALRKLDFSDVLYNWDCG